MEIVYRAANIIEAHIVAGMLNACGIQTHVGGHFLQGAVGDLSPTGIANVLVLSTDKNLALAIVKDYEQQSSLNAPDEVVNPSSPSFPNSVHQPKFS